MCKTIAKLCLKIENPQCLTAIRGYPVQIKMYTIVFVLNEIHKRPNIINNHSNHFLSTLGNGDIY